MDKEILNLKKIKEIHEIAKSLKNIGEWKKYGLEIAEKYSISNSDAVKVLQNREIKDFLKIYKERVSISKNHKSLIDSGIEILKEKIKNKEELSKIKEENKKELLKTKQKLNESNEICFY